MLGRSCSEREPSFHFFLEGGGACGTVTALKSYQFHVISCYFYLYFFKRKIAGGEHTGGVVFGWFLAGFWIGSTWDLGSYVSCWM